MPAIEARKREGAPGSRLRHVLVVCTGEQCRRRGALNLLNELAEARACAQADLRIAASRCLGHCALAPAMMENGELLAAVSGRKLRKELRRLGLSGS